MDYYKKFKQISEFISKYLEVVNNEVIYDYQVFESYYPTSWIEQIRNLSLEDKHLFDTCKVPEALTQDFQKFLEKIYKLTEMEEYPTKEEVSFTPHESFKIKGKKLHELNRLHHFFEDHESDLPEEMTDIAGGMGHLARMISSRFKRQTTTIDFDEKLHAAGKKRLIRYPRPDHAKAVKFLTDSFGPVEKSSSLVKKCFHKNSFSVGLHTCGPLAIHHIDHCISAQSKGLLNFGCCYLRMNSRTDLNLSSQAKQDGIKLSSYSLTLAARGNNFCTLENFRLKERVKRYRYTLHLLQRELLNIEPIIKIGDCHRRVYWGSFYDYIKMKSKEHGLKLLSEKTINDFYWETKVINKVENMFAADLIRWRMGRVVELYILIDRVLYLNENNYESELVRLFDEGLSPRNIGIYANNLAASLAK